MFLGAPKQQNFSCFDKQKSRFAQDFAMSEIIPTLVLKLEINKTLTQQKYKNNLRNSLLLELFFDYEAI